MKIFVAIPAYDRKISVETARSLLNEQSVAALSGIEICISFVPGCSLITHARNQAVKEFLDSDCDKMIFIDSDVAWEPGNLLALALHNEDFVGGAYRYKDEAEGYPVGWIDQPELWANPEGLLEVAALPAGFLCLTREVFSKLAAIRPERVYKFHERNFYAFFHCPPGDGEDGAFCRDWRDSGGKVWLEPRLNLSHIEGGKKYTGNIGEWLKSR